MIDLGQLEINNGDEKDQHVCMQLANKKSPKKPKPLVIHFTRDAAPRRHQGPLTMSGSKPIPFPYKNYNFVSWRYALPKPSERKEETTDIDSLSARVTNITSLSGVTHSGRILVPPDLLARPANAKGKAKVIEEQTNKASPVSDEDVPTGRFTKRKEGYDGREVSL